MSLLEVKNLEASIKTKTGAIHAIEDISFSMEKGEILGVVGESGCGKSMPYPFCASCLPRRSKFLAGKFYMTGKIF